MDQFFRMQQLAGIKSTNNDLVLEGINIFINIFSSKLLTEAEKKETASSLINNLPPEALAFYKALGITYDKLDQEGQKLLADAFKEARDKNLSPEEVKAKLLGKKEVSEAEDESESKGVDAIGKLGNWIRKSPVGKAVRNTIIALVLSSIVVPPIVNTVKLLTPNDTVKVEKIITQNQNANLGNSDNPVEKQALQNASDVGIKTDKGTLVIPFKLSKGDQAGIKDPTILNNFIKSLKAKYSDNSISGDITLKVKSYASNTNNAEKSTTSKSPLSQERGETIQNLIPKKIGNVNVNVEIEKGDYKDLAKETGKDATKGAVVTIDQTNTDLTQTKSTPSPDKLLPIFNPEYAKFDVNLRDKEETDGEEETSDEKAGEEAGKKTDTTSNVTPNKLDASKAKSYIDYFPNLNRNGQLAVVLSAISPKASIFNKLGTKQIKSFTDNELTKVTNPEAKKIANLILNLRKNPDSLIKKMSAVTGIKLGTRAKAIQTAPGQKYQPSSQLQKSVAENISLIELLNEAVIDNVFAELGISDNDIKVNRMVLLALIGSMYAQQGNTSLSILNPKDLTPEEQNELKDLGFTPQGAKGEYIFLKPGQGKANIQARDFDKKSTTVPTKPDVKRLDTYLSKQSTLKGQIFKINTTAELEDTLKDIIKTLSDKNPEKFSNVNTQKRVLDTSKNRLKYTPIKELQSSSSKPSSTQNKSTSLDASNLSKLFKNNSGIQSLFNNINDEEEAIELILRVILKYASPELNANSIKSAIDRTKNSLEKSNLTEEFIRMQKLAGLNNKNK